MLERKRAACGAVFYFTVSTEHKVTESKQTYTIRASRLTSVTTVSSVGNKKKMVLLGNTRA